jgi:hypothetical protein
VRLGESASSEQKERAQQAKLEDERKRREDDRTKAELRLQDAKRQDEQRKADERRLAAKAGEARPMKTVTDRTKVNTVQHKTEAEARAELNFQIESACPTRSIPGRTLVDRSISETNCRLWGLNVKGFVCDAVVTCVTQIPDRSGDPPGRAVQR